MSTTESGDMAEKGADSQNTDTISRRGMIGITAAVAGGVAALAGSKPAAAQAPQQAPAVLTGTQKGRRFRAFITFENTAKVSIMDSNSRVETVTMKELDADRIVVRTEAAQVCYTMLGRVAGPPGINAAGVLVPAQKKGDPVQILGHSAVGIVEAIGSAVKRVKVGDRVLLANTPQCGVCHNCLRGRPDRCLNVLSPTPVIGALADGTQVMQQHDRGGFSELVIPTEQYAIPMYYNVNPVQLSTLGCSGACGLGTTTGFEAPVAIGSDVVVLGCGPVGLSAVQGARIKGASQIIAVEPIAARRAVAQQVGATTVIDPNVNTAHLVEKIRDLCKGPNVQTWSGGVGTARGADFVIEAVGGDYYPPKVEAGPDPKGLISLRWAWDLCSPTGQLSTVSIDQHGDFSMPANQWSNGAKSHHPGNFNGVATLKDMQIYARLIEKGQFNAKALATATYPLDRSKEALQAVSDRTTVGAVIVFG